MKYFQKIAEGVDVMPLAHAVIRQPELFNANRFRTTFPNTPHGEVDDILIRFSDTEKCPTTGQVIGDENLIWHPAYYKLPEIRPLLLAVMNRVGAYALDRVLISRLRPGRQVKPHADNDGSYVHEVGRARYHLALQGLPGSNYTTGDETVCMRTGELWWFAALEVHSVQNNSADDRIHLLIDVRIAP